MLLIAPQSPTLDVLILYWSKSLLSSGLGKMNQKLDDYQYDPNIYKLEFISFLKISDNGKIW